jgi:hypothetical protein
MAASVVFSVKQTSVWPTFILFVVIGSSCQHPKAAVPATPSPAADQFAWKPAKSVPPDGCAVTPPGEKGVLSAGAKEGSVPDSSAKADPAPRDWGPQFQIPDNESKNFSGEIAPLVLKPGAVIYRVIGLNGNPTGAYWASLPPPTTEAEWRATYAVFVWWNGASCVEKYVVPKHRMLKVWEGKVGPQVDAGKPGYYLAGGAIQIWIPASNSEIDPATIKYAPTPWKP